MSIVVIGSINIDLVTKANKFPKIGETIIGNSFNTFFGGKGANQAICAARLGSNVQFIGCVGKDAYGEDSIANLVNNNVNVKGVSKIEGYSTGIAQITIAEDDNSIIIIKGANDKVNNNIIDQNLDTILKADIVLLQLEIPVATVEYVVNICHKNGITTVLNPAPAVILSNDLIDKVTYIIPNELEYSLLFEGDYIDVFKKHQSKLIVTRGINGVDYHNGERIITIKPFEVDVVDTTGAGDSFTAAFCVGLENKLPLAQAILFGNRVASFTIQKLGAQSSMPFLKELE
ncbi:MAG: ribokinase [Candidatus Izemoplasma sp.]